MKQNICELDTMIFFREALEAHEFMLLPVRYPVITVTVLVLPRSPDSCRKIR